MHNIVFWSLVVLSIFLLVFMTSFVIDWNKPKKTKKKRHSSCSPRPKKKTCSKDKNVQSQTQSKDFASWWNKFWNYFRPIAQPHIDQVSNQVLNDAQSYIRDQLDSKHHDNTTTKVELIGLERSADFSNKTVLKNSTTNRKVLKLNTSSERKTKSVPDSELPTQTYGDCFFEKPDTTKTDKIAVLFGINYEKTSNYLATCCNDVVATGKILSTKLGYKPLDILWFTDSKQSLPISGAVKYAPTASNLKILWAKYILPRAQNNHKNNIKTEVFFHYSGHGTSIPSTDLSDLNGEKQAFYFLDGTVLDEEFYKLIIEPLPSSTRAFFLLDACHSSSIINNRYCFNPLNLNLDCTSLNNPQASIISISGCRDEQTSAAGATSKDLSALTRVFVESWENTKYLPTASLITDVVMNLRRSLLLKGYRQIPELSMSHPRLLNMTFFK